MGYVAFMKRRYRAWALALAAVIAFFTIGLGNIVFFVFGGFIIFLGYVLGGILQCLTIVGIPFGIQSFKLAGAVLWPFGKEIRQYGGDLPTQMEKREAWMSAPAKKSFTSSARWLNRVWPSCSFRQI